MNLLHAIFLSVDPWTQDFYYTITEHVQRNKLFLGNKKHGTRYSAIKLLEVLKFSINK